MARVEINEVAQTPAGRPVGGATVEVRTRPGNALATVYSAETGGTSTAIAPQITADLAGRIEGWLDPGSYNLIVRGRSASYTQPIEAVVSDSNVAAHAGLSALTQQPHGLPALNTDGHHWVRRAGALVAEAVVGTEELDAKVAKSLVDAKGDLLVGTADNTVGRLGVGANGQVLTADSAEATGIKWSTPTGASGGLVWNAVYVVAASGASQRLKDAADYVADGTGDQDVFQSAHDAMPSTGGKIIGVGGTFNFNAAAAFTKPVHIELSPETKIRRTTAAWAMTFTGTTGTTSNCSANVAKGVTVISVASTTGLVAGDPIYLNSTEDAPGATNPNGNKGERNYIKTVDSATQLTLAWKTKDAYTTATTAKVQKIVDLVEPRIEGGVFTQDGPLSSAGFGHVQFYRCLRPTVDGTAHERVERTTIEFRDCLGSRAENIDMRDYTVDYPSQYYGYGVMDIGATMFTNVSGVFGLRTGAVFGGGSEANGIPRFGKVSSSIAVETGVGTASFSSHPENENTTFENCESHDALEDGFVSRGKYDRFNNCIARRSGRHGIVIREISRYAVVNGATIQGAGQHGIVIGISGNVQATEAVVISPVVTETTGHGIWIGSTGNKIVAPVVNKPDEGASFKVCIRVVAGENNKIVVPVCSDATGGSGFGIYMDLTPAYPATQVVLPTFYNIGGAEMTHERYAVPQVVEGTVSSVPDGASGVATLVGGTVTIAHAGVTSSTRVQLTRKTPGGTLGHLSYTVGAGTMTFKSESAPGTLVADTSTIGWRIETPEASV